MKKILGSTIAVLATASLIIAPALSASADEASVLPPGWTVESFTSAAAKEGYSPETIRAALVDTHVLAAVTVKTVETNARSERAPTLSESRAASAAGVVIPLAIATHSHTRKEVNVFGVVVRSLTLHKQFSYNGGTVSAISSWYDVDYNTGLGEAFVGVAAQQEYYSTEAGRPNGAHTSYIAAKFDNRYLPGIITYWVQIKGIYSGNVYKTSGG